MEEILPFTLDIACMKKWESYTDTLWKTTVMLVDLALSLSLRLQGMWVAPR